MFEFLKKNFFLFFSSQNFVFVDYFTNEQGIKTVSQIKKDYVEVQKAFTHEKTKDVDAIRNSSYYNIFEILNGSELIASVYIRKTKYYTKTTTFFRTKMREEDAVEIYSLYVNYKYRGKGFARKLLYHALRSMKNHYNFSNSFIIGLHLNEADKFMNISFSLYYSMNFRKSSFVKSDPSNYAPMFQEFYSFNDPIDIIKNPSICKDNGSFFAMYTRYSKFLPFNIIKNKNLFKLGEKLRGILKERKLRRL